MAFDSQHDRPILERTPGVLRAWLADLPPGWTADDEGGESWSPFEIVGHLIHGEHADWIPRARHILAHGTALPFEPFDCFHHLGRHDGRPMNELLDEFAAARAASLAALDEIDPSPARLALHGLHPELGEVTMAELFSTWVVHDLSHLAQIARTMARRLDADVGPWGAFLPILGRPGAG